MAAARGPDARLAAILGPTNTGKTHLAIERMLGRTSGVIGLPLRLLAREVYDKVVAEKGRAAAALITGEEKIAPPTARYFVCTVEAMPTDRNVDFVAVDEVQLAADPVRGHVFTQRLLHARGTQETLLLGAETMRPLIRGLLPKAEHDRRERFSAWRHVGATKLPRLPRRSAIVAFSAAEVYAIAELMRRQRGGAAVVMGALSPRTRNAQVALYQSGEVDFLVATDAIGMGLNMDVDHVAFASLTKFDGRRRRPLRPDEIGQIAGRAGRFRSDGTFGTSADSRPLPDDVAALVEAHEFEPVRRIQWRNPNLDFDSVEALRAALAAPPPKPQLRHTRHAVDEAALEAIAGHEDIVDRLTAPAAVKRLWSACQIPDFRKTTVDQHVRLIESFARHLLSDVGRLPVDWVGREIAKLDDVTGDVDALANRLAHIRTWTYAANRADWMADPEHWRGVARDVEDRLSDALHERLTQRFVDRRTSALMRGLRVDRELEATVAEDGAVVVEDHFVGRLDGLVFHPDRRGSELEARALRSAAYQALRPVIDRRLGEIAREAADGFDLGDDLGVRWRGRRIGKLTAGHDLLCPRVRLVGGELGSSAARARALQRLESWVGDAVGRDLAPLVSLKNAVAGGGVTGLARGLAFQLIENLGSLERSAVDADVGQLSTTERRALRTAGVRIGEHVVFLPDLVKPAAARLAALLLAAHTGAGRPFLPQPGRTSAPVRKGRALLAYAAAGYRACGPLALRLDVLERLADLIRDARKAGDKGRFEASDAMLSLLGATRPQLAEVLKSLGYVRARTAKAGGDGAVPPAPELWRLGRRRRPAVAKPAPGPRTDSPFAVLADLKPAAHAAPRRTRKPRRP